jgi:purine-nucleoside phosphorylase
MNTEHLAAAAALLREHAGGQLDAVIVLGSGLGDVLRGKLNATTVPYTAIPGMPEATIAGHAGEALIGELAGRRIVAYSGRFHLYEGNEPENVIYPVLVAAHAGAHTAVLTNAAGGVNASYRPGDLMSISDQLNLTGRSPLMGKSLLPGVRERFIDMLDAYDPLLRKRVQQIARDADLNVHEGVYAGLIGPAYETPAEARMLRTMGADAVGMSTVLETILARALGLRVVGFSLITNVHLTGAPTTHAEVLEASKRGSQNVAHLIEGIVATL